MRILLALVLALLLAAPTPAAYDFAGATDTITTGFTTSNPAGPRSWSIWHYQEGDGGSNAGVMWTQFASSNALRVLSGTLHIVTIDWSPVDGSWTWTKPSNNAWHNTVITYDGSLTTNDPIVYVDGVVQTLTETSTPSGTIFGSGAWLLGNNGAGTANWDGRLCEFAIWNRILDASEAKSLGERKSPMWYPEGRLVYEPLIRAAIDYHIAGALTVTGATVLAHPGIIYKSGVITNPNVTVNAASNIDVLLYRLQQQRRAQ